MGDASGSLEAEGGSDRSWLPVSVSTAVIGSVAVIGVAALAVFLGSRKVFGEGPAASTSASQTPPTKRLWWKPKWRKGSGGKAVLS